MDSIFTLRLGKFETDWRKNSIISDHSALFRATDLQDAECYSADGAVKRKPAFVRKLRHVLPRLDLLGFSMEGCRRAYEEEIRQFPEVLPRTSISFEVFRDALCLVDLDEMRSDEYGEDFDLGEFASHVLQDPAFHRALSKNITRYDGILFENLDTCVILRLLGENVVNLDRDLVWSIQDEFNGGSIASGILDQLADASRFLVVTEGSSDSDILKKALPLVAPDVDDFFHFIDMGKNYPFTGTGNLGNFCKGLAAIKVQNKIVVVLDNDTAGRAALENIKRIPMPPNIRVIQLPELEEFRAFPTLGPSGRLIENVNGRAVAIECFLDPSFKPKEGRVVRWTGFNAEIGEYQGELVAKKEYTKNFFGNIDKNGYDLRGLLLVWSCILQICTLEAGEI